MGASRCWLAIVALASLPYVVLAEPSQMILNGDFEAELGVGWFESNRATAGNIQRTTTGHPDADYEVEVTTVNGEGRLGLIQRFPVVDLDLAFNADMSAAGDGTAGAWIAAGLMLTYRAADWTALGQTAIVYPSRDCPWIDSPTFHMITADPNSWESYGFSLLDELLNLPGVDPGAIALIDVAVMIEAENC